MKAALRVYISPKAHQPSANHKPQEENTSKDSGLILWQYLLALASLVALCRRYLSREK